jgi:hypothetical protein
VDSAAVANVHFMMSEVPACLLKAMLIPSGVASRPEEVGPHVVVHADDVPTEIIEVAHDL